MTSVSGHPSFRSPYNLSSSKAASSTCSGASRLISATSAAARSVIPRHATSTNASSTRAASSTHAPSSYVTLVASSAAQGVMLKPATSTGSSADKSEYVATSVCYWDPETNELKEDINPAVTGGCPFMLLARDKMAEVAALPPMIGRNPYDRRSDTTHIVNAFFAGGVIVPREGYEEEMSKQFYRMALPTQSRCTEAVVVDVAGTPVVVVLHGFFNRVLDFVEKNKNDGKLLGVDIPQVKKRLFWTPPEYRDFVVKLVERDLSI